MCIRDRPYGATPANSTAMSMLPPHLQQQYMAMMMMQQQQQNSQVAAAAANPMMMMNAPMMGEKMSDGLQSGYPPFQVSPQRQAGMPGNRSRPNGSSNNNNKVAATKHSQQRNKKAARGKRQAEEAIQREVNNSLNADPLQQVGSGLDFFSMGGFNNEFMRNWK